MRSGVIVLVVIMVAIFCHQGESMSPRGRKSEARECLRRNIPQKMLRELNDMTSDLITYLPSDGIKHLKLLCNFGKSMKKTKGIQILKEVVEFYQEVFGKVSHKDQSQSSIQVLLSRLGKEVKHCSGTEQGRLPSKERNCIKKMKETFIMLKTQGVYKAVGEFHKVLEWIDSYRIQQKTPRKQRQIKSALRN